MSIVKKKESFMAALKAMFFAEQTPAGPESTPADTLKEYKTAAGASVMIDKIETGGMVYESDRITASKETEIKLSDGTVLTLDGSGNITEAKQPEVVENTNENMAAVKLAAEKFATGTPEERINNLETMCKALMLYCFNWKIEDLERKTLEEQAIAVFQTLVQPAQFNEQLTKLKENFAAQEKIIKYNNEAAYKAVEKLAEVVMSFAKEPGDGPAQKPAGIPVDTPTETPSEKLDRSAKAILRTMEE